MQAQVVNSSSTHFISRSSAAVILASFALNALVLLLTFVFITPFFLSNDDVSMMLRAAGVLVLDKPTGYLMFTSGIIGNVLKELYSWKLSLPWYGLYYVFVLWLVQSVCLSLLSLRWGLKHGLIMFALYYLSGGFYFTVAWQFTMLSILTCVAGGCAVVYSNKIKFESIVKTLFVSFGIALMLLSVLIRLDGFYAGCLFMLPVLFFDLIFNRRFRSLILLVAICASVVVIRLQWNQMENDANDGFTRFNIMRSTLSEYGYITNDPVAMQLLMQRTGWSYNDCQALRAWLFTEVKTFNHESLERALDGRKTHNFSNVWKTAIYKQVGFIKSHAWMIWSMLFFIALLVFVNRRSKLYVVTTLILFVWLNVVLIAIGAFSKPPPFRVQFPLWLSLALVSLLRSENIISPFTNINRVSAIVAALAFGLLVNKSLYVSKRYRANEEKLQNVLAATSVSKPLVNWGSALPLEAISPFRDLSVYRNNRLINLGVFERSPQDNDYVNRLTRDISFENALVENQIPIAIDSLNTETYLEILSTRYREHRDMNVSFEKLPSNYGVNIFRVRVNAGNVP